MKKILISLLSLFALIPGTKAQDAAYKILHQTDTIVKARIEGVTLGSRDVRYYIYEYPSTDPDGQPVTISGIIMAPSAIADGSTPCDGIIMFNHHTIGSPQDAPSQGELDVPSGLLANPLSPNYIIVMSDYIGYGSSIDHQTAYLCGDTNARNSLDGLLAARQLLTDENISQGKFLFNMGYSQGGTESMYAAKLCDMDSKYKDIVFDKTFAGGGLLDCEKAYSEYIMNDKTDDINDVVMFLIAVNENCHLGIDYHDLFQEPMASHVQEVIDSKSKSVLSEIGVSKLDSLHQLLQPAYMDLKSDASKALIAKLAEIKITNGWEPNLTRNYYLEHSRHDNYVPVQCARSMIRWMKEKGFQPSLVPGKTSLQTNMLVFKLKHQQSAIIWAIQTMAAVQVWPVIYYEGEQNRYYHNVVHDLNLMKVVKYLESMGIDLRKMVNNARELREDFEDAVNDGTVNPEGSVSQMKVIRRASFFDILSKISDALEKVDLTLTDAIEMLDDSGISMLDIMEVVNYIDGSASSAPELTLDERIEPAIYLLRYYEQMLANWYLLGGLDVEYGKWGW